MSHRSAARNVLTILVLAVLVAVAACTGPPGGSGQSAPVPAGAVTVAGLVHAGPTCPVAPPSDPACADRPISGAVLIVTTPAGTEVTRTTSSADGTFSVALAPGDYILVPQPVDGLLGTARPITFRVPGDGTAPAALDVAYDTGIR